TTMHYTINFPIPKSTPPHMFSSSSIQIQLIIQRPTSNINTNSSTRPHPMCFLLLLLCKSKKSQQTRKGQHLQQPHHISFSHFSGISKSLPLIAFEIREEIQKILNFC
ncbi:hypothetical protein AABB24_020274, partial [Solanum stoloniferum]